MTGFLVDTNVISLIAPSRFAAPTDFLQWLESRDAEGRIFLSAVTLHELEKGVALLNAKGASAKSAALRTWLDGLLAAYQDRILPLDAIAASQSGAMEAAAIATGQNSGMADAAVAGIAKANDLVIVTDNAKHFLPFGVATVTPEEATAVP